MNLMLASATFALALLAAAAMGLALQRGTTCTVAAMDEMVNQRRATRLWALLEAALWVAAGLLLAQWLGLQPALPALPPLGAWTLVGALLLGLGALVNGACVLGAIARLGSGQWAYLATPLGFYAGCVSVPLMLQMPSPATPATQELAPVFNLPATATALLVVAAVLRLTLAAAVQWRARGWRAAWSPHAATSSIGVSFLLLLLVGGAWSYTDVLAELAHHMSLALPSGLSPRIALFAALLLGALLGGRAAGAWQHRAPTWRSVARCLAGGWLLGCGSLLVPGGNDSLILLGLPLLWPHAWVGFAVMCAVIATVLLAQRLHTASATRAR